MRSVEFICICVPMSGHSDCVYLMLVVVRGVQSILMVSYGFSVWFDLVSSLRLPMLRVPVLVDGPSCSLKSDHIEC